MKILFIAMSESIHTARWINQIADLGWDIHLYPSIDYGVVHKDLRNVTVYHSFYANRSKSKKVTLIGHNLFFSRVVYVVKRVINKININYNSKKLEKIIRKIKPDIIHSLETQHAGYLTLTVKNRMLDSFPLWIHSNWGSDIYLFGRLKEHREIIRELISKCDYYSSECNRDVDLAREFGFTGEILPVYPNTGGFDLSNLERLKERTSKTSDRKVIVLKGYQGWAGRALVGLRALSINKSFLSGYKLIIYSNPGSEDIKIASELLAQEADIEVELIPMNTPHEKILTLHGEARISIGLSISDAISTSLLEAMAMGSFPVQSWTSCADEWIKDGESGILVPPEDPDIIAKAIFKALSDDNLVNQAAELNWELVKSRLDFDFLKQKTIDSYKRVFAESKIN